MLFLRWFVVRGWNESFCPLRRFIVRTSFLVLIWWFVGIRSFGRLIIRRWNICICPLGVRCFRWFVVWWFISVLILGLKVRRRLKSQLFLLFPFLYGRDIITFWSVRISWCNIITVILFRPTCHCVSLSRLLARFYFSYDFVCDILRWSKYVRVRIRQRLIIYILCVFFLNYHLWRSIHLLVGVCNLFYIQFKAKVGSLFWWRWLFFLWRCLIFEPRRWLFFEPRRWLFFTYRRKFIDIGRSRVSLILVRWRWRVLWRRWQFSNPRSWLFYFLYRLIYLDRPCSSWINLEVVFLWWWQHFRGPLVIVQFDNTRTLSDLERTNIFVI